MSCWDCIHDDHDYGFCTVISGKTRTTGKPRTTGNSKTCPYFEKRKETTV